MCAEVTPIDAQRRANDIAVMALHGDIRGASMAERKLHIDALRAIDTGPKRHIAELASIALSTLNLPFDRVFFVVNYHEIANTVDGR